MGSVEWWDVLCVGDIWWVRDMCGEVWGGGTCCVWGIVRWVRDIMCREVWSGGTCCVWGIYGGLEI
jgi:hypothetical protein